MKPQTINFLAPLSSAMPALATTPEVDALITAGAPVAIGVSGGKDSDTAALEVNDDLNKKGHTGPRILIHSHLGRVEWQDALPQCLRLAEYTGLELVVVEREAGDMMDRWLVRKDNNEARYAKLECVKLILPWSTPSMRFCTSELKTAVICRELVRRFPGQFILSVTGIRGEESSKRAKSPIVKAQPKLTRVSTGTSGFDWHPLLHWRLDDVKASHERHGFAWSEVYRVWKASRLSCAYCIMSTPADLAAAAACPDNKDIYIEMVDLEVASTFSFQDSIWLGDVAPHLLPELTLAGLERAKKAARIREAAEAQIPPHLLYTAGWPTVMPTWSEAVLLCQVRRTVADAVGLEIGYTEPSALSARYEELMQRAPAKSGGTTVQPLLIDPEAA